MKKSMSKKVLAIALALVLCFSVAQSVYASTASTPAGNYGTLTGSTSASIDRKVSGSTTITTNPDNAYLTLTIEIKDMYGSNMGTLPYQSSQGETSVSCPPASVFHESYKAFGSHGVQGGSTNPPKAVYTVTTI